LTETLAVTALATIDSGWLTIVLGGYRVATAYLDFLVLAFEHSLTRVSSSSQRRPASLTRLASLICGFGPSPRVRIAEVVFMGYNLSRRFHWGNVIQDHNRLEIISLVGRYLG
jgi:hypothetical protein